MFFPTIEVHCDAVDNLVKFGKNESFSDEGRQVLESNFYEP